MFGDKIFGKHPWKFPTPADIPEDTGCRTFRVPSDPAWFALLMGAILPLTDPENYQQFDGGISAETTAEIFSDIIETTYENAEGGCEACIMPGGGSVVRIGADGHFEELIDSEWLPPAGDNTVPPVPPREGGTDEDKRCLAAANATNTMKILYETLADDYAAGLTLAEAISHFIAVVAAIIFLPGGLIAAAIALALVLFRVVYETAAFVTADYWTAEFDDKFQCALYECASVDGEGVVTFDFECFQTELSAAINAIADPFEVVLWGQVQAMLMFLGVDGLNLAGATTAIPTADCDVCDEKCFFLDFRVTNGSGLGVTIVEGSYTGGTGIVGTFANSSSARVLTMYWAFGATVEVTRLKSLYTKTGGAGGSNVNRLVALVSPVTGYASTFHSWDTTNFYATLGEKELIVGANLDGVGYNLNTGSAVFDDTLHGLWVYYKGDTPAGWSENCE